MRKLRKVILCFMSILMIVALTACGSNNGANETSGSNATDSAWKPSDEVTIIVPYSAGGSSDLVARLFSSQGASAFETPLVVNNVPGGGQSIGFTEMIQAKPDGLTIGNTNGSVITNALNNADVPYIYYEELQPIVQIAYAPYVVYVRGDSNIQNLDDLKNEILSREVILACNNRGGQTHWEAEYFAMKVGGDVTSVIYGGGSDSIAALLGGHADITVQAPADGKEYVKSGDLRAIAILDAERLDVEPYKDVPTSAEQGYEWFTNGFFHGYSGPKGLDSAKIKYFEDSFKAALEIEGVASAIENYGFTIRYQNSEEFAKTWEDAVIKYTTVFEELGDRLSE